MKSVSKTYHDKGESLSVLKNVDLGIDPGMFYSLCGPSGAGKTTLLNIISGLDRPDHGEVWFEGQRIDGLGESAKAKLRAGPLGFIFQNPNLIAHLSALENVELPTLFGGETEHDHKKYALFLLGKLNLKDNINKFPSKLSEGERRRVSIARALVTKPKVVLADEPTINLDSDNSKIVVQLLKESVEGGASVLVSTHDEDIARSSNKIFRISFGNVHSDTN